MQQHLHHEGTLQLVKIYQLCCADDSVLLALADCKQSDLVFLLDRSEKFPESSYSIMIDFIEQVVKAVEVSEAFFQVGLAQFSNSLKDEFYLKRFFSREDIFAHLRTLRKDKAEDIFVGKALQEIRKYFFPENGARSSVSHNLVLISNGDSTDDVEEAAKNLRQEGVNVFTISTDPHLLELLQITNDPRRVFRVQTVHDLASIKKKLLRIICDDKFIPDTRGESSSFMARVCDTEAKS